MKPIFHRRRIVEKTKTGAKLSVQVISVDGFKDDSARQKASIVISVQAGSHPRYTQKRAQALVDSLNKAWTDFYEGDPNEG